MSCDNSLRDENQLGFQDAVRTVLRPLLTCYGFNLAEEYASYVRYRSSHVTIDFTHHPLSYEIEFVAYQNARPGQRVTLQDLIDSAGGGESAFFQASNPDRILQCLASVARLIERYGDGTLRGDAETYSRMAAASTIRSQRLTTEVVNRPIREAAAIAWRNLEFVEVKRLYESIQGALTDIEAKRLELVTKRLIDQ